MTDITIQRGEFSAGDMADQGAKAFRAGQPAWTRCEDGLPDDDSTVLIAFDDGEVWTGYIVAGRWRYVSGELITAARVTHWMDLPEPPHA